MISSSAVRIRCLPFLATIPSTVTNPLIPSYPSLLLAVLRDDFRENPQPVTVAAGETATFHCQPPRGEPEPKVLWRRNGKPVVAEGRITITEEGDLVLASVEHGDTGDYTCLALNKGGEKESAPASLTVLGKEGFGHV